MQEEMLRFRILRWAREQFGDDYLLHAMTARAFCLDKDFDGGLKVSKEGGENHEILEKSQQVSRPTLPGCENKPPAATAAGDVSLSSPGPKVVTAPPGVSGGAINPYIILERLARATAARGPGAKILAKELIEGEGWGANTVGRVLGNLEKEGKVERISKPPLTYWRALKYADGAPVAAPSGPSDGSGEAESAGRRLPAAPAATKTIKPPALTEEETARAAHAGRPIGALNGRERQIVAALCALCDKEKGHYAVGTIAQQMNATAQNIRWEVEALASRNWVGRDALDRSHFTALFRPDGADYVWRQRG